jgi:hypothetical protein
MNASAILTKAGNLLRNRVLRNVLLWPSLILLAHGMNVENDKTYHYGFLHSPWYWWVLCTGFVLQLLLVLVNNLILIPRLLQRKQRLAYACWLVLHVGWISACYTIGLKMADAHIDVDKLQQVGMITSPISTSWSADTLLSETWAYFVGNLLWVFVFSMAWYMNDYARQRKAAELAKQQQTETELAFLQSQLAPHFLFNTLNNIYALTLKESSAAPDAMLKLSAILRSLLYEGGSATVPFEKEAEIIRAYTDLELLRLKDAGRLQFHVDADGEYAVPPLLWLPVLENIFKHGTRIISEDLFVDFSFVIKEGVLHIRGHNYCKEAQAMPLSEKGIGLKNLRQRLHLLFPGRHTIHAGCENHIFTTEVSVKLS